MLYEDLTTIQKNIIKETYYKNKSIKLKELNKILPFEVSIRTVRKVLSVDFSINTRRKNRYTLNENFFDVIDTEEKSYILGLICADGCILNNNGIIIALKDLDVLEKIKIAIEYTGEIRRTKKGGFENSKEGYCIKFSSENIKNALNKLGVYSNKSLTFGKIPEQIPKELKRHFLRGYFDGDGSITSYQRTYNIKNKKYIYNRLTCCIIATEPFIKEIIKEFNIEHYNISNSKTKELKYIRISSKEELFKLYDLLYKDSNIFMNRKEKIWTDNIKGL